MSQESDLYENGYYKGHGFPAYAKVDLTRADIPEAYKRGIRDALAGRPSTPFATTTPPAAPAPAGTATTLPGVGQPSDAELYQLGYAKAKAFPASARADLLAPGMAEAFKRGIRDGLAGLATAPPAAPAPSGGGVYIPAPNSGGPPAPIGGPYIPVRPAPAYNPNLPPGRVQVVPGNARFYEVLATNPLGKMPYDFAVGIERQTNQNLLLSLLQTAISFEVLGADPGDYRRGYGLSGPNGVIAERVYRLISQGVLRGNQADPAYWGLDGWYGAKTRSGFKLLGKGELQALGLIG